MSFGEFLRRLRRKQGRALQHVAREARMSVAHLSRLENDKVTPTTKTVTKLREVLGGDLREMLERAGCLPPGAIPQAIHWCRCSCDHGPTRSAWSSPDTLSDPRPVVLEDEEVAAAHTLATTFSMDILDAMRLTPSLLAISTMSQEERERVMGVLQVLTGTPASGGLTAVRQCSSLKIDPDDWELEVRVEEVDDPAAYGARYIVKERRRRTQAGDGVGESSGRGGRPIRGA